MLHRTFTRSISKLFRPRSNLFQTHSTRRFFCQTPQETQVEESSEDKQVYPPQFTSEELKVTPLAQVTLKKLVEAIDQPAQKRFLDEFDAHANNRKKIMNLQKEIKAHQDTSEKNKDIIMKLKQMVESERAEAQRIGERMNRELEKEKTFAISKFSKEILEVIDNLQRVLKQCQSQSDSDIYQGVEVVLNNSLGVLRRFDIHPMEDPIGQIVNLDLHEIVFHAPYPGKEDGEILDVSESGFLIGTRVLRAAKVGVVKNNF